MFGTSVITALEFDQNSDKELHVFPMPATDVLNFQSKSMISEITISTVFGQKLLEKQIQSNECQISIGDFNKGVYIAAIRINNKTIYSKIIVE